MLLSLAVISEWLEKLNPDVVEDGCPTGIEWVTWGVAKTDPWDNPFHMDCGDETGRKPRFRSAGPDGSLRTDDDVVGFEPLVSVSACAAGCEAAFRTCAADPMDERARRYHDEAVDSMHDVAECASACSSADHEVHFYVDTCRLLADCTSVADCVSSALQGQQPSGSCQAFGMAAAKTFAGSGAAARELADLCERDVLPVPELVCVEASKTPDEAALCHLTVSREWPELSRRAPGPTEPASTRAPGPRQ